MINILINSCWFTISLKINTSCVTDVLSKLRKVSVSKLVPFHSETYKFIQVDQYVSILCYFFLSLLALNSFLSLMISSAALDKFIKFVRVGQKQETKEREK